MTSLLLALVLLPAAGALLAGLLRQRQLYAVAVAVATLAAQAAVLTLTPDGGSDLLGLNLQLGPLERLFLFFGLVPVLAAILYHARVQEESSAWVTTALAVSSAATLVALTRQPFVAALTLLGASLVLSVSLVAGTQQVGESEAARRLLPLRPFAAALRYLSLATLASVLFGIALTLNDYFRLNPDQSPLVRGAFAFLVCGLALRLGLVPFHYWLPTLFDPGRGSGLAGLLAVGNLSGAAVLFVTHVLAGEPPLLLQNELARGTTQALGLGGAAVAAVLAYAGAQRRTRILAYLYIADAGVVLFGLASGTALGLSGALTTVLGYSLSVPLFLICLNLLERGYQGVIVRVGLVVAGLSVVGFVPLYGFAARYQLYAAAAAQSWGWLAALTVVSLLLTAAVARHFVALLFSPLPTATEPVVPAGRDRQATVQIRLDLYNNPPFNPSLEGGEVNRIGSPDLSITLLLLLLIASSLALGLYPAPLTGVVGGWVAGLGWLP